VLRISALKRPRVAIVHDYLTQRGGAERVVLAMARAFPGAVIHTSLYEPSQTFPEFADLEVRTTPLNRVTALRRDHRRALPLLAPTFARYRVDADVVLCSSSGWAHGVRSAGRKVVYCYTPARWLYQADRYLAHSNGFAKAALLALHAPLLRWDRRAADSADDYLTSSHAVRERIAEIYGREADVIPPPYAADPEGPREPVDGVEPGFWLLVARLLPYKNVDVALQAFSRLPERRLVIVGRGPDAERLRRLAGPEVTFLEAVSDAQLRWLYAACTGLVAISHEDYGLTPLEAAAFGKPTVALRWGVSP